jgi:hypothetical protein
MSLNHRQRHQLYRMEARLFRSDPQLAAMLAVFGRLSAGQRMPAWEQIANRQDRIRQAAALIARAIATMTTAIGLLLSAVLALLTAVVMGSRARPAQRTRQQAGPGPGADDHPDPADWS